MAVVQSVAVLAVESLVRHVLEAASQKIGGGELTEAAFDFLLNKVSEQSARLVKPLQVVNERAWLALEIMLAGELWWERVKDRQAAPVEQLVRQKLRTFLEGVPLAELAGKDQFRVQCLRELQAARQGLLISGGTIDPKAAVRQAGALVRVADPARALDAELLVLKGVGEELKPAGYANLAWLAALKPKQDHPVLLAAIRAFFHRELDAHRDLLPGLDCAPWHDLTAAQEAGFAALSDLLLHHAQLMERMLDLEAEPEVVSESSASLDVRAELARAEPEVQELGKTVLKLVEAYHIDQRELRPSDSLSSKGEVERQQVQAVVERFAALPPEVQQHLPAVLNGIAKLEVVVGEFAAAQGHFHDVAGRLSEQKAQAEVYHNAYQAALENRNWPDTLAALRQAAALDPQRFAPFPLNKFEPEKILGAGGYGVAFLCRNRHSGTRVVIKALRLDGLERQVAEVFREAQVVEELDHPAIVRLRDCDYSDAAHTKPYLVMDYFDGITLADHVEQNGPLTPADLLAVARPAADALLTAHARGLLHRDVKPANLLVRHDNSGWSVKLIDFGLALKQSIIYTTLSSSAVRQRTALGTSVAGTLDYAAPEQMGRLKGVEVGTYSDVYSFGKSCYFALMGTPEPDDEEKENLPGPWRKLLSQCTARTVEKRLPDFKAVLERLDRVEAEMSGAASAAPAAKTAPAAATPPPTPAAAAPQPEPALDPETAALFAQYEDALRKNPHDLDAYYGRGAACMSIGDYERAIADFTAVLELDPTDPSAYLNRGNALRLARAFDDAVGDFAEAIKLDPGYVKAYINRGNTYEEMGEYERAIDDYIEAVQIDPNSADAYNSLTWLLATCPNDEIRDGPKAVEYATTACELTEWKDPNVLDTLAAGYAECREFAEAVKCQKKAFELADEDRKDEFRQRIQLYQSGKPYREKPR